MIQELISKRPINLPDDISMQDFIDVLTSMLPENSDKVVNEETVKEVFEKLPDNISEEDVIETVKIIKELHNRINNFDESKCLTTEELRKELGL